MPLLTLPPAWTEDELLRCCPGGWVQCPPDAAALLSLLLLLVTLA